LQADRNKTISFSYAKANSFRIKAALPQWPKTPWSPP